MRMLIPLFLWICVAVPAQAAGEPYKPLFAIEMPFEKNTTAEQYMKAYRAPTREAAIKEWEAFLAENAPSESAGFEDATELALIRQAHYELSRLYYLSGNVAAADKLMLRADAIVAYEVPDRQAAKRWCESHGYCK